LLYVANVAWFFASHRLPLALAARREGYDVHVAAGPDGELPILEAGLPFHPLPLVRGSAGFAEDLTLLRSLVTLYRHLLPDLVQHISVKPVLFGSLAARHTSVPWVVNAVSGMGTLVLASGARAALRRAMVIPLLRLGSNRPNCRVIFQNVDDRAAYRAAGIVAADRAVLIPGSGVDLVHFNLTPVPDGVPVVVVPARLIYDKGIAEFVEAARLLRSRGVTARFLLAGGLDPHNATAVPAATVEGWVREGLVEWIGHRPDMARVYESASIVCLPSYREGMSKALLEAAASGRAIVTTDTPGCRDCIVADRSGLLVPARNAVALARALQALLEDPPRRAAFGVAGRALAERAFDVRLVIDQHLALYRSLMSS
jgi:glycosyltransferase involved in cell wall biosynthesis